MNKVLDCVIGINLFNTVLSSEATRVCVCLSVILEICRFLSEEVSTNKKTWF